MLLAKASEMAPLSDGQWSSLDQVAYANLISHPERYTGRPIRLRLYVQLAQKLIAGSDELAATPDWRQGNVVWRIDAMEPEALDRDEELPIRLFCVQDPTAVLGRAIMQDGEELVFGLKGRTNGPLVEVAGLFYKTWDFEPRQSQSIQTQVQEDGTIAMSSGLISNPILVVWDMRLVSRRETSIMSDSTPFKPALIITILVMLVVVFYLLKRTIRQRRQTDRLPARAGLAQYHPLRDVELDDEPEAERDEEDEAVDPDLAAAADAFRREREEETPDA